LDLLLAVCIVHCALWIIEMERQYATVWADNGVWENTMHGWTFEPDQCCAYWVERDGLMINLATQVFNSHVCDDGEDDVLENHSDDEWTKYGRCPDSW
jgi:hypothetical protein